MLRQSLTNWVLTFVRMTGLVSCGRSEFPSGFIVSPDLFRGLVAAQPSMTLGTFSAKSHRRQDNARPRHDVGESGWVYQTNPTKRTCSPIKGEAPRNGGGVRNKLGHEQMGAATSSLLARKL